jgi:hypothetical protein
VSGGVVEPHGLSIASSSINFVVDCYVVVVHVAIAHCSAPSIM